MQGSEGAGQLEEAQELERKVFERLCLLGCMLAATMS